VDLGDSLEAEFELLNFSDFAVNSIDFIYETTSRLMSSGTRVYQSLDLYYSLGS
jgi:hypothetical protein